MSALDLPSLENQQAKISATIANLGALGSGSWKQGVSRALPQCIEIIDVFCTHFETEEVESTEVVEAAYKHLGDTQGIFLSIGKGFSLNLSGAAKSLKSEISQIASKTIPVTRSLLVRYKKIVQKLETLDDNYGPGTIDGFSSDLKAKDQVLQEVRENMRALYDRLESMYQAWQIAEDQSL